MTDSKSTGLKLVPRSRAIVATLAGLLVGIIGILMQYAVTPEKFPGFPPGVYVIGGCGVLVWLLQRLSWGPLPAILVTLQIIVLGGFIQGELTKNLQSSNMMTVIANLVLLVGMVFASVAAVVAIRRNLRDRARRQTA